MNKLTKIIYTVFFIVFIVANTGHAEVLKAVVIAPDEEIKLSFPEALQEAFKSNHEFNASVYDLQAHKTKIAIARSNFFPHFNFSQDGAYTSIPATIFGYTLNQRRFTTFQLVNAPDTLNFAMPIGNFLSSSSVTQSVFSMRNIINFSMTKKAHAAKSFEMKRTREKVVLDVSHAYLSTIATLEGVKIAQQSVQEAKEALKTITMKFNNKQASYSDVLKLRTTVKNTEQNLIGAVKNHEIAKKALGLTIGVDNPVEVYNKVPVLRIGKYEDYKDNYLQRADIKAVEVGYENAENFVKMAKAAYYPELIAGANYDIYARYAPFGFDGNFFFVYGVLKWNVFDGLKMQKEVELAKIESNKVKDMVEGLKQAARFEIFKAYRDVEEKEQKLQLAKSSLAQAQEGAEAVKAMYKNSQASVSDVLDAQLNLSRTKADIIKSQNEYLSSALNLSFTTGTILKDLGLADSNILP